MEVIYIQLSIQKLIGEVFYLDLQGENSVTDGTTSKSIREPYKSGNLDDWTLDCWTI